MHPRETWAHIPAQNALDAKGVPEEPHNAVTSPTQNARAWEGAARPQGLFPSYACRNGRGARDLHAIAYGNIPAREGFKAGNMALIERRKRRRGQKRDRINEGEENH